MARKSDSFTKMAVLINRSKRELEDGCEKNPIDELRLLCYASGPLGILKLGKALRKQDNNERKEFTVEDLKKAAFDVGFTLPEDRIQCIFEGLDIEKKGTLNVKEILEKIRPPMTVSRVGIINKAFTKADPKGVGIVTLEELKKVYSVKDNPKYLSGEMTESEIITKYLSNFDICDDKISKEDFINYYATISASIDNNAYFDLQLRYEYNL